MPLPDTYASHNDLATYWGKALSVAEQGRVTALLGYAATIINELPGAADQDGNPAFSAATCKHVSLDMVKRAMLSRGDGVTEEQASMADMLGVRKFVNPVGNLYLTAAEIRRLTNPGSSQLFSLTPTSNVRVPGQPWNYQPSAQADAATD